MLLIHRYHNHTTANSITTFEHENEQPQLMESDSIENLELWTTQWNDLVDFEIIPIIDSETAMRLVLDR